MKFVMERKRLLEALAQLVSVAPTANTIPILNNVLVVAGSGRLALTATDMDRVLTIDVEAVSIGSKGTTTVNAASFLAFARAAPDGCQIEAELVDRKGDRLVLRADRAKISLPVMPAADFPPGPADTSFTATFDVSGTALTAALHRVVHAISNEETRYYLNGVYLHRHENGLRLVATDGHRLALAALAPETVPPEDMAGVIVPRMAIRDLLAMAKGGETLTIEISANGLRASATPDNNPGVVFRTKLVDGTFPDYFRVIPGTNESGAQLDRARFQSAVQRCAVLVAKDYNDRSVKLVLAKRTVTVSRNRHEQGEVEDEMDAQLQGKESETGFNYAYMAAALEAIDGATVDLDFTPGGPILLRDAADRDGQLQVVMAMRV